MVRCPPSCACGENWHKEKSVSAGQPTEEPLLDVTVRIGSSGRLTAICGGPEAGTELPLSLGSCFLLDCDMNFLLDLPIVSRRSLLLSRLNTEDKVFLKKNSQILSLVCLNPLVAYSY